MSNLSIENLGSEFIEAGPNLGAFSAADFAGGGGSLSGADFTSGSGNLAAEAGGILGGLGGLGEMIGNFAPELAATGGALGAGLGGLLGSFDW